MPTEVIPRKPKRWKTATASALILLSIVGFGLSWHALYRVDETIKEISNNKNPIDTMVYSVIVRADDTLENADQVEETRVGYYENTSLQTISNMLPNNAGAPVKSYNSYPELVSALYNGEERVIFFDEAFRDIVSMSHPNFLYETRILRASDNEYLLKLNEEREKGMGNFRLQTPNTLPNNEARPTDFQGNEIVEIKNEKDEVVGTSIIVPQESTMAQESLETLEEAAIQTQTPVQVQVQEGRQITGHEPFIAFLSGIDTYGGIDTRSNSDVNIVMAVNPQKKQVVIVPIPRDSYVPIVGTGGYKDKLTHAGALGLANTAKTAGAVLGVPIDVYVKVNFSTLVKGVDLLGGITVNNPRAFTSAGGIHFAAGNIRLSGSQALAFSRERKAFGSGDFERGRNQGRVIEGIINEALKPNNLLNYSNLFSMMGGTFRTNVSDAAIRTYAQNELNNMGRWSIETVSLSGNGVTGLPSYFLPRYRLSFIVLDQGSIMNVRSNLISVIS